MWSIDDKEANAEQIKSEEKRLKRIYSKIDKNKKATIEGLIQRAAFMRVSLAELEDDLLQHGFTEWFSQGDQEPYLRKRPTADLYNTMNTSYQKIIKQLSDLLPKDAAKPPADDGFDGFVNGREEY
jgi:hypothetical protein